MILHVDMDAFYASVEERERPELAGRPLIVGGTPEGRGVVAAANYAVRQFGVHSAMPTATALRLCPQAIVLPPRHGYYAEISAAIRAIFGRYTPLVEPLSLDEAFLDVAGSVGLFGPPEEIARRIKREIKAELHLVASVGVAPNKFLAKIASDLEKPDALVVVDPAGVQQFLDPLPVRRLWGVGRSAGEVLSRLGVETVGDLRRLPVETLTRQFGKGGGHLRRLARGIDERRVVPDRDAKSISHETTFSVDVADHEVLRAWLLELTEQVARRLRRRNLRGRTVTLKVRFSDFRTITRSQSLPGPTHSTEELWQAAVGMLETRLPGRRLPLRLLGMGVSGLDASGLTQGVLFGDEPRQRDARLDDVSDAIHDRFGGDALRRASALEHRARRITEPRPGE